MSILFELRYPTKWYTKVFTAVVAVAFFTGLATLAISGFLVYRIVKPQRTSSEISLLSFPGRPEVVQFQVPGSPAMQREGWFFPGLLKAPTIVLCHGYESSRGELLTLVSALQDHQYNVFVFDFTAHGANEGITTFGYRETGELRAAIATLAARGDVAPNSFGVWGYNMGAYVALREAETDKRVKALVLDSVYDQPSQMVKYEVEQTGLGNFPFMVRAAEFSFEWLNYEHRMDPPVSKNIGVLAGVPKLFIEAADDPELAALTRKIFVNAPEPKEEAVIPHGNYPDMGDEDKRTYENRIVTFFLLKLPATGTPVR
jgi:pimeloyl-ACP methyl ester carboxylesterase